MPTILKAVSFLFIAISLSAKAQRPNIKFGDIKLSDFSTKVYSIDSAANAVVLADIGSSKYEGDSKGGFSIVFKRHLRMRILSRNAFDAATISIPLYASGSFEEKIENLDASTFNEENGKVIGTKLDKASIFKDKLSKNYVLRKFTMPNLKEGCIVDIKYTLLSPYERDIRSWQFQGNYPAYWSEYQVTIPSIYDFAVIKQGFHPFKINKADASNEQYNILVPAQNASDRSETVNFRTTTITNLWAMENVPAIKKENYITTLDDYVSRIDFQLSKIRYPNEPVRNVMSNWMTVADDLMKDPLFGEAIGKNLNWLEDDVKKITAGASFEIDKAKKIYNYVRDNITCTDHTARYLSNPLKRIWQSKSGSVADINLLLTAMMTTQHIEAHPVMLSTRDHGKAYEVYPIMDKFNYVITRIKIDDIEYLLDASYNKLGFGKLNSESYNGYARTIDKAPLLINMQADSLSEDKLTTLFIVNDEKAGLTGTFTSTLGYNESYDTREKLVKTSQDDFFKGIKKAYGFDIEMTNASVDSLKVYEEPVTIKYDLKFDTDEDIIYLNPLFTEAYKENPFKSAERLYPVEMPYKVNETFILRMDVPKGYKVEEIPKSTRVKLSEDEGMFEYIVTHSEGVIQLRSKLVLNKATFDPEAYQGLRDFFGHVVKKQSEQIVFKKIKN